MHFTLSFPNGTVVDSTQGGEPMAFVMGDGSLDPGLEQLLLGLKQAVRVRFNLMPGQAFGESDPGNVHRMAREEFPEGMALEEGTVVGFGTPTGDEFPGTVIAVNEDAVEVDFNHPLASRELVFEVEVVSVRSPTGC